VNEPKGEFAEAMKLADTAMQRVLGDAAVWIEEAQRPDPAPLPWPLKPASDTYARLLQEMIRQCVVNVMAAMAQAHQHALAVDPQDPEFQWVLRVVKRAVDEADQALLYVYSTPTSRYRLSGKRDFINWIKGQEVEAAVRSGLPRAEALAKLGFSRAAAYRAMKRKRP
jgi:hypothetical protein